MKIEFLVSLVGMDRSITRGDVVDWDAADALRLVASGFARAVETETASAAPPAETAAAKVEAETTAAAPAAETTAG